MEKTIGVVIAIIFAGFTAGAQTPVEFTLQQAQAYAVKNSYQTQQLSIDAVIAQKEVNGTKAIGLPQVNGNVDFQNFLDIPTSVLPENALDPAGDPNKLIGLQFGTDYTMTAGLTATQLVFDGSYFVGLQAAKTYVLLANHNLKKSEIEMKEATTVAYYTVVVAEENLKVLEASKTNIDKTYKETKALYQSGFAEEQDADQVKIIQTNIDNSLANAERQVKLAYDMLKFQMGLPLADTIALADGLETLLSETPQESFLDKDFTFTQHIDYQMVMTGMKLNELNLKNEKAGYLPSLGVFVNHSQNAFRNEFNFFSGSEEWYPTTVWGVNLKVPIFSSNMRKSGLQKARLELDKSKVQQKQVEEALKLGASSAKSNYEFALRTYSNDKDNLELARSINKKTQIKYKEGLSTSFELTQSENQLQETQGKYIGSILQLFQAKSELDKALSNY